MKLVAKTLYGLEEVLAAELNALGAEKISVLNRAVMFEGPRGAFSPYSFSRVYHCKPERPL
jgi:23S rRNA G2445 N2-methylase RlmL